MALTLLDGYTETAIPFPAFCSSMAGYVSPVTIPAKRYWCDGDYRIVCNGCIASDVRAGVFGRCFLCGSVHGRAEVRLGRVNGCMVKTKDTTFFYDGEDPLNSIVRIHHNGQEFQLPYNDIEEFVAEVIRSRKIRKLSWARKEEIFGLR